MPGIITAILIGEGNSRTVFTPAGGVEFSFRAVRWHFTNLWFKRLHERHMGPRERLRQDLE